MATPRPQTVDDIYGGGTYYNGKKYDNESDAVAAWARDNPQQAQPRADDPGMTDEDAGNFFGWIAAQAGQTPEEYGANIGKYYEDNPNNLQAPVAQFWGDPIASQPTTANGWAIKNQGLIDDLYNNNGKTIGGLQTKSDAVGAGNDQSIQRIQDLINAQGQADSTYIGQSQGLVDQLGGYRDTANAYDWANLGTYQQNLAGYNTQNNTRMSSLDDTYARLQPQLQSTLQANVLTSQAAQAYADPAAIQAQNEAQSFLQGGMNGSLDYVSQGASTYANAADVAAQQQAAGVLQGISQGSMDVDFQSLPGMNDLYGVTQGSKDVILDNLKGGQALWAGQEGSKDVQLDNIRGLEDLHQAYLGSQNVHVGQEDPGAYAAMNSALAKYTALTDPRVTDAERFLYEKARQEQEQDERANRGAVLTNLRQRGLSGSSAEIADAAIGGQRASQNRLLSDLGANAQAIQRSMDALAGMGNLSGVMSAQANDIAKSNAQNRLAALSQYVNLTGNIEEGNKDRQSSLLSQYAGLDAGLAESNMNRQTSALQQYTGLGAEVASTNMNRRAAGASDAYAAYSDIRKQGFNEAAFRAESADTASRANQQTRLQSGIASGNLASTQREQSFNEAFKRGAAADQTNQFNELNRVDVQKYNQNFAQKERDSEWARSNDWVNSGLRTTEANSLNDSRSYTAGKETNEATYGRNQDVLGAQDTVFTRQHTAADKQTDRGIGLEGTRIDNRNTGFGRDTTIAGLGIQNEGAHTAGTLGVNGDLAGDQAARSAREQALINAENERKRNTPSTAETVGRWFTQPGYGLDL
jgi:hypothetical protein